MSEKKGIVDISALTTPPEKHELATARFFAQRGRDVSFICPSSIPEVYRPDILMDGMEWEIKAPIGSGKKTIERNIHKAVKQSKNIIFDFRRIALPEEKCLSQLEREFNERGYLRNLLVIKKNGELVEYSRK
ncbi:MAG: hypothetical protein IJ679_00905 [Lachnospiraceae bacterium]|nr:hypothetical protein [Lachnospiraceae bacterium]